MSATAFAPGSIGNVGPGFDVLGLAIEGIGDRVTIEKGLPLSGGLGGSAASSVAGAFAAAMAMGSKTTPIELAAAALQGEMTVAGEHLDNIAPSILGGLALSRSVRPIDIIALTVAADWRLALVTPDVRIQTKAAREVLPSTSGRAVWVQQMANTAGVVHAFATGDGELLRRALDDRYAEPRRAALIPHFNAVKRAAIDAGAFACTISGSGPTLVAICADDDIAHRVTAAMQTAFEQVRSIARVSPIARQGVHAV